MTRMLQHPMSLFHAFIIVDIAVAMDHVSMLQTRAVGYPDWSKTGYPDWYPWMAFPYKYEDGGGNKSECGRRTIAGQTKWKAYRENQICVNIDTSSCAFTGKPVYLTSLTGKQNVVETSGSSVVVDPTKSSMKVCVGYKGITPDQANKWEWHINWLGFGSRAYPREAGKFLCVGRGRANWDKAKFPYAHYNSWKGDPKNKDYAYTDVSFAHCGFKETPIIISRLGGTVVTGGQQTPMYGDEVFSMAHPNGFRVTISGWVAQQKRIGGTIPKAIKDWNNMMTHVLFGAYGKVSHSFERRYPVVSMFTRWADYDGGKRWTPNMYTDEYTCGDKENAPVYLASITGKPFAWNQAGLGTNYENQCGVTKMIIYSAHWNNKKKYTEDLKSLKNNLIGMVYMGYEKGSPTPPPTPPTPMPPTPPPTPEPTLQPTAAPTAPAPPTPPKACPPCPKASACCDS